MSVASIPSVIATEISARAEQVQAAIDLIDGGATIPFIARYRKEATGGLDDAQLRTLEERLGYLREMEARRETILKTIRDAGKLTPELEKSLLAVTTKAELEDLYLPYKPKRRTRADAARENGLAPLAEALLENKITPEELAAAYINDKVADGKAALEGARDIIAEHYAENAETVKRLRDHVREVGVLSAKVAEGKEAEGAKFANYFAHSEPLSAMPSHRLLAVLRGRNEGVLSVDLGIDADNTEAVKPVERIVAASNAVPSSGPCRDYLMSVVRWAWRVRLQTGTTIDVMAEARERAEMEAIRVFGSNLKELLLASPAGQKTTMGLDPGIRTGVKVAVVDATGKVLDTATIYPFQPRNDTQGSLAVLGALVRRHNVALIAIGNGTASRETDKLAADLLKLLPSDRPLPAKVVVSEAGASVYSASELASNELPGLDVSLRGAVSIARRLQDPLAELVKIDPKSIGVGQYQHDVDQFRLAKTLDAVVEDAVNAVGVDLNTASPALLARVSGLSQSLAAAVVAHRDAVGPFESRDKLLDVPRLGPKAFQMCAGFLRIRDGKEPLDASAVHPEAYKVARSIVQSCGRDLRSLMGDTTLLKSLDPKKFVTPEFGIPTIRDILGELQKPGRDPRPEFKMVAFDEQVQSMTDLKPGQKLEGVVTNVAAFGAFVDIGVHQDGLVHLSKLADRFIKDPSEAVKVGDIVKVVVLDVDVAKKRISLSMKKNDLLNPGAALAERPAGAGGAPRPAPSNRGRDERPTAPANNAFAAALKAAQDRNQPRKR